MFFKSEVEELVKQEANKRINATLNFKDVGLNLFSSFPNIALSINELTIVNIKPFEGDTLLSASSIEITIDLISIILGDKINVKTFSINDPHILLFVLEDGTANYNIMKESTVASLDAIEEIKDTTQGSFRIGLEGYSINNGVFAFVDQKKGLVIAMKNLTHSGSGEFSQDDFILDTKSNIDEFTYEYGGVGYLKKVNTEMDMQLHVDLPNFKFTIQDNRLRLNNLLLNFKGSIAMPEDDPILDLSFTATRTEFKDIISLIPAIYMQGFEDIESSGKMDLTGSVKGISTDMSLPSFNLNVGVVDGKFKYPDLPMPVSNVNLKLSINNPGGKADNTIVDLHNAQFELGKDSFNIKMLIKKPISGPYVEAKMKGAIDLGNIKNTLQLENITNLSGKITADMEMKGIIPTEETTNYEEIDASGEVIFNNIVYQSTELPDAVKISSASLTLTPKFFRLKNLAMKIGESDVQASGSLKNFIPYTIGNGTLIGDLNVSSNYLNVNPFLTESADTQRNNNKKSKEELNAIEIPRNLNLTINGNFNRLLYDNLDMKNVKGKIIVKDKVLTLSNLNMSILGGSMIASGKYKKNDVESNPDISFDLTVDNFNVKETYNSFLSVSTLAPIVKYINGKLGAKIKLNSTLDNNLMPIWNTFNSTGSLDLKVAEIKDFKPFTTLGNMLSINELSNPKLQNVKTNYRIANGRFYISPVSYKIKDYDVQLVGSGGMDKSIDYVMELDIPAEKLKNQANSAVSSLLGKDIKLVSAEKITVNANLKGTIDNPKITTSAEDVATDIASNAIKQAEEEAKRQAEAYADSLKNEAERKLKEEAEKQQKELEKKLEEETKNLLQNLFKKKG